MGKTDELTIPTRDPDFILPRVKGKYYRCDIWLKENVALIHNGTGLDGTKLVDNLHYNQDHQVRDDIRSYIEDMMANDDADCPHVLAAVSYFAEQALLGLDDDDSR